MAICDRTGCKRTAEVAPKVVVPHAAGAPFDPERQHSVLLGLKLCRRCCLNIDPVEQASHENFRTFITEAAKIRAKNRGLPFEAPDFTRARVERVRLDSAEYRRLAPKLDEPAPAEPTLQ